MNDENFLSEFASPVRINILTLLEKEQLRPSQIAKRLKITIQGINRHIERLSNASLIEKTAQGTIAITPMGNTSLVQVRTIHFLFKSRKYFASHSFEGIPDPLLRRLGELENVEFIENQMEAGREQKKWHILQEIIFLAPLLPHL